MGIFRQFPYANFHELNLDWLIENMEMLIKEWSEYQEKWNVLYDDITTAFDDFKAVFDEHISEYDAEFRSFMDSIDINRELRIVFNQAVADGTLASIINPVIATTTTEWLETNITEPEGVVIDRSLTVDGACADASVTGMGIRMLRDKWLNLFNKETIILNRFIDGSTGELTPSPLYDASEPIRISPSTIYTIKSFRCINDPNYRIYFYDANFGFINRSVIPTNQFPNGYTFTTPANAFYIRLNFESSNNTATQDYKTCVLLDGTKTINEYINPFTAMDMLVRTNGLIYKNALPNNTDFNNVRDTGIYAIDDGYTYLNNPYTSGTLFVVALSNIVTIQIAIAISTGAISYRRRINENWLAWKEYDSHNTSLNAVMFGDSIAYGEVYPVGGDHYRADVKNRIPNRIAECINIDTIVNHGEGGSGFVYTGYNPKTIVNKIKESDLSLYDIMIISGGRNDSSVQLGSTESMPNDGTICGAVKEIINYVKTNFPMLQMVWIQTTPNTAFGDVFTGVTIGGWSLNDMKDEIGTICNESSIPYITWEEFSIIRQWQYICGNVEQQAHPATEDAYRKMGNYLGGQVSKYYLND